MKSRMMLTSLVAIGAGMILCGEVSAQKFEGRGMANSYQIQELLDFDAYSLTLPSESGQAFTAIVQFGQSMQNLDLQPYSMRADDFQVLITGENGTLVQTEIPPVTTYRGIVRGDDESFIAASLINGQLWASVILGSGELWVVQPATGMGIADAAADIHIVYRGEDVKPLKEGFCGVTEEPILIDDGNNNGSPLGGTGLSMTDIGLDADYEFYLLNASSVPLTVADMELVINSAEFVYERDVDISYEITTIIVRDNPADPYTSTNPETLLNQFRSAWLTQPELGIRRDVAHLFTGKNLNGSIIGIAWVGSVCSFNIGYGLAQSRFFVSLTFRGALSAHEIGHNWNAGHCNGSGNCHIMCSGIGGCNGIGYFFGTPATGQIINFRNSRSCLFDLPQPLDPPFFESFPSNQLNTNNWIYNFGGIINGNSINPPSGSLAMNLDGSSNEYSKDEIRSNFIDLQGESDMVLSYYTEQIGVEAGESLIVEYKTANNGPWVEINEIISDGVNQTEFEFHSHVLPGNAYHNEFRIRFRTQVSSSTDDWYIDDISILAIPPCPADLDGDGAVGTIDLLFLLGNWGPNPGSPADLDGDDVVGTSDLLILLGNWGPCP